MVMAMGSYVGWLDDPWSVMVTLAVVIFFTSLALVIFVAVTFFRYTKYINQQSLYQASYEHPEFVELPSFIREYETQSLDMYVPPDESTPSYGEVGMRIHGGESHRVVDVHHSSPISGVVSAVNPMCQFDQHTSQSEQHSSILSTTSLGESTTIL